jgi:uncharacterized membrane protein YeaQ/YmgE (transglycosylase-associated protein family)
MAGLQRRLLAAVAAGLCWQDPARAAQARDAPPAADLPGAVSPDPAPPAPAPVVPDGLTIDEFVAFLIVGFLVGSFVGMLATRRRGGFGRLLNLVLGLAGAIVGGFVFDLLGIDLKLGQLNVTYANLLAALIGALVVLAALAFVRRKLSSRSGERKAT